MSENNLKHWKEKIRNKRKNTSWRNFIKEIGSWFPLMMYKNGGKISAFPETGREGNIVDGKIYIEKYENTLFDTHSYTGDFFEAYAELFKKFNKPSVIHFRKNENSDFSHCTFGANNVYLSFVVGDDCDNVMYSVAVYCNCTNIFGSILVHNNSSNIYGSKGISDSYNVFYSLNIHNSSNIRNSSNLIGCHDCIECDGLENASYYYQNKQYTKEEFLEIQKKYQCSEYTLGKRGKNFSSNRVLGEGMFHSEDIDIGYYTNRCRRGKNIIYIGGGNLSEDFYDVFEAGINSKDFYGVCNAGTNSYDLYCSCLIDNDCSNIFYSYHLDSCSYCVGCIGLKNKSYCIFNKQYEKQEWLEKVNEIFESMESQGELGKFFPGKMTPFYFNHTAAALIDDFTQEEVEKEGYMWLEKEIKVDIPKGVEVIGTEKLEDFQGYDADGNWQIKIEILQVVIQDEKGNYYRIVQEEYDFLVKHSLPIPNIHWLDRMKLNFGT